jgi:putative transposase
MRRKTYPSDLNDAEWDLMAPLIPPPKPGGRPRTTDMREVLNAIFYVVKTGCQWDLLPHDFRPKGTVYSYFNTWRKHGVWERMNTVLREQVRLAAGRAATPSAASLDSQSAKTTEKGGFGATTVASRSTDGNAISWWIPWACC